jgi:hypothetical protein
LSPAPPLRPGGWGAPGRCCAGRGGLVIETKLSLAPGQPGPHQEFASHRFHDLSDCPDAERQSRTTDPASAIGGRGGGSLPMSDSRCQVDGRRVAMPNAAARLSDKWAVRRAMRSALPQAANWGWRRAGFPETHTPPTHTQLLRCLPKPLPRAAVYSARLPGVSFRSFSNCPARVGTLVAASLPRRSPAFCSLPHTPGGSPLPSAPAGRTVRWPSLREKCLHPATLSAKMDSTLPTCFPPGTPPARLFPARNRKRFDSAGAAGTLTLRDPTPRRR